MKFIDSIRHNPRRPLSYMVGLNVVFGLVAIAIWYLIPSTQTTLQLDMWVAVVNAAVSSALFGVALFGIVKKQSWGAVLACGITVSQRILGGFIFDLNVGMVFMFAWTVLMVNFAYLELKLIGLRLNRWLIHKF